MHLVEWQMCKLKKIWIWQQLAISVSQLAPRILMLVELISTILVILSLSKQSFHTENAFQNSKVSTHLALYTTSFNLQMTRSRALSKVVALTKVDVRWSCSMKLLWANSHWTLDPKLLGQLSLNLKWVVYSNSMVARSIIRRAIQLHFVLKKPVNLHLRLILESFKLKTLRCSSKTRVLLLNRKNRKSHPYRNKLQTITLNKTRMQSLSKMARQLQVETLRISTRKDRLMVVDHQWLVKLIGHPWWVKRRGLVFSQRKTRLLQVQIRVWLTRRMVLSKFQNQEALPQPSRDLFRHRSEWCKTKSHLRKRIRMDSKSSRLRLRWQQDRTLSAQIRSQSWMSKVVYFSPSLLK